MNITQWFCCTNPPVREGTYEYRMKNALGERNPIFKGDYIRRKWYGYGSGDAYVLLEAISHRCLADMFEWRGLADKPA